MRYGIFSMRWASASRGSVSGSGDSLVETVDRSVWHWLKGSFPPDALRCGAAYVINHLDQLSFLIQRGGQLWLISLVDWTSRWQVKLCDSSLARVIPERPGDGYHMRRAILQVCSIHFTYSFVCSCVILLGGQRCPRLGSSAGFWRGSSLRVVHRSWEWRHQRWPGITSATRCGRWWSPAGRRLRSTWTWARRRWDKAQPTACLASPWRSTLTTVKTGQYIVCEHGALY